MISPKSSFPVFIVDSLIHAKVFYTGHFGFSVVFENEWYLHIVSECGVQAGFMLPDQPSQPDVFRPAYTGEGVIFSLEVQDVDRAYDYAQEKSLEIILELRSEAWGQRHFCVQDPNGLLLDIVQEIEPEEEYQQGYATE